MCFRHILGKHAAKKLKTPLVGKKLAPSRFVKKLDPPVERYKTIGPPKYLRPSARKL